MDCFWNFDYSEKHAGEDPFPVFDKFFLNGLIQNENEFKSILDSQQSFKPMGKNIADFESSGKKFEVNFFLKFF